MRPSRPELALIRAGAFHVGGNFLAKGKRAAAMLQIHGYSAVSPEFISILVYIIHW